MAGDFLIRGTLADVDPAVAELIRLEHARQMHKLIMIASESYVPQAVREAEGSVFQNIYAEGYPHVSMHGLSEDRILDYGYQMPFYRRHADRRYYKGVEYCNIVEALAQRRAAEAFCPPGMSPEQLFVNVQPLSGAVANLAIYEALLQPGDVVMTLDLLHGGHLSHGSSASVTGRRQRVVHYRVNPETELLDYEELYELAQRERPRMIIAGFTSYPWAPDFRKFREIADSVNAYLMADIAHTAGMAIAGAYPNPVGIAHVTAFTTHKTLMGPRGAVIITTDPEIAQKIDRSVFPGLQGGPHMNKVAAMATMFKIAQTPQFKALQHQIARNAVALSDGFKANGLRVVHGGTNTHMVLLDCKSAAQRGGVPLMGNIASRILDLVGIVCNRNTIPGDKDASQPSALRFGTPWVTQRGLDERDMREIADIVTAVLRATIPFATQGKRGALYSARADLDVLRQAADRVQALVEKAGCDVVLSPQTYPHTWRATNGAGDQPVEVRGEHAEDLLASVLDRPLAELSDGGVARLLGPGRQPMAEVSVRRVEGGFVLNVSGSVRARAVEWLRLLSEGYVVVDDAQLEDGAPGPVEVWA